MPDSVVRPVAANVWAAASSSACARSSLPTRAYAIAQEEAKAISEIRALTVDVAISAARQVIVAELDERRGAALIDAAIAGLPQQLQH